MKVESHALLPSKEVAVMPATRRLLSIVTAGVLAAAVASAPPALAKRPAPNPGGGAAITSVVPFDTGATVSDMSGTFCVYNADVAATWTRTSRLNVYPVMHGTRFPPGELSLKGSGSATVTVPFVLVPVGGSATLLAELTVFTPKTGGYQVVASQSAGAPVTCRR
jgi:hypothetical protein